MFHHKGDSILLEDRRYPGFKMEKPASTPRMTGIM
jgi:hypothetical protein